MIKNKSITFLLIFAIILIFSIFYSCSPTPVNVITDANMQVVSGDFVSTETILGEAKINANIAANRLQVGFDSSVKATLTNISGEEGVASYTFQNGNLSASVRVADANSIYLTLTSLKAPFFNVENVLCVK